MTIGPDDTTIEMMICKSTSRPSVIRQMAHGDNAGQYFATIWPALYRTDQKPLATSDAYKTIGGVRRWLKRQNLVQYP